MKLHTKRPHITSLLHAVEEKIPFILITTFIFFRFVLYYYSNYEQKEKEGKETKLTIATFDKKEMRNSEIDQEDWEEPQLESLIKTK